MTTTPRIRTDLLATPVEDAGIHYFDVSDPRSRQAMRLYDFEWLLAAQMDGARSFEELAAWARTHVGFAPSPADLTAYALRLEDLGFIDAVEAMVDPEQIENEGDDEAPAVVAAPLNVRQLAVAATDEMPAIRVVPEPTPAITPARSTTSATGAEALGGGSPAHESRPLRATPLGTPEPTALIDSRGQASDREPGKGSSSLIWGILVIALLAAGGYFLYTYVIAPTMTPVSVSLQAAPAAREQLTYYAAKGVVSQGGASSLAFGEAGKVSEVVVVGTEVKPGMSLARLDSFAAIEKELADVRDREAFYAAKNDTAKVAEKRKRISDLEARAKRVRLVATSGGTVGEVLVAAGATVKPGDLALKIVDRRALATFTLAAAEAAALKPGAAVELAPAGPGPAFSATVAAIEGSTVKVELPEAARAVKPGDTVRLVRTRGPKVIALPLSALTRNAQGADQVFVISADGVVVAKPLTVVERTAAEVLVSSGITPGDKVVVGSSEPLDNLKDGQRISAQ